MGDARPQCTRVGPHKRHRAQRYLRGVGTTTWEWKGTTTAVIDVKGQDLIVIAPTQAKGRREAKRYVACKCKGLIHECRRYSGLLVR